MEHDSSLEPNIPLLFKKFSEFYINQVFITTAFTTVAISVPILSQIIPVHASSHFLKLHFIIITPFASWYPKRSLSLFFPTKTLYASLLSPIRATCLAHLSILDWVIRVLFDDEYMP